MEQSKIDLFSHQNRYNERDEDYPSSEVYEHPLRTFANGWKKWHASRDCGRSKIHYLEMNHSKPVGDRYEWILYCFECGHEIPEDEVLFIDYEWFNQFAIDVYDERFDELWLPQERVLEIGPNPNSDELLKALELTKIELDARSDLLQIGFKMWNGPYNCNECEKEIPARLEGCCLDCYDGDVTTEMTDVMSHPYGDELIHSSSDSSE